MNGSSETTTTSTADALQTWLLTTGSNCMDQHSFIDAYCHKLRELGLPVERFFMSAVVLHPLVAARSWKWESSGKITDNSFSREQYWDFEKQLIEEYNNGADPLDGGAKPPVYQLMMGAKFVLLKSSEPASIPDDCQWMLKENYTELYGLAAPGMVRQEHKSSGDELSQSAASGNLQGSFTWSTKAKEGFTEDQLAVFNQTLLALAIVLRLYINRSTSKFLLMTYLGEDAGSRVHSGDIERGEGLTIRSAIWFSDVRGFTKMSGELERNQLVGLINDVFEVTQQVVRKHKGQVLKFMGDGCMAIFSANSMSFQRASFSSTEKRDLDDDQGAQVCYRARLAAAEIQDRLAELQKERDEKGLPGRASVGVGLHYGDISYGNVGAPDRLDFTVLGPHVNLASRTESLCAKLQAKVLATNDFVKLDGDVDAWTCRGEHQVKGVEEPVPIFELSTTTV